MKIRTAIRKSIKWGGAVTVVLLVAVWVASGYWTFRVKVTDNASVDIGLGCLAVRDSANAGGRALLTGTDRFRLMTNRPARDFLWAFQKQRYSDPQWMVTWTTIPLWCPILLVFSCTSLAWWLDRRPTRRARLGHCPTCGYDRRGITSDAVCPECGAAANAGAPS